jgi:hypothetical protein
MALIHILRIMYIMLNNARGGFHARSSNCRGSILLAPRHQLSLHQSVQSIVWKRNQFLSEIVTNLTAIISEPALPSPS